MHCVMVILTLVAMMSQFAHADYPEIPAECAAGGCVKILSITSDVSTSIGYSRTGVKSSVWIKTMGGKLAQIIFHQPKNSPLHDVVNIVGTPVYVPNVDRNVFNDPKTETLIRFNSGCRPADFAARTCTRFEMKIKDGQHSNDWAPYSFELDGNQAVLLDRGSRRDVNTLTLKAYVDHIAILGGVNLAHFTSIEFSQK